MALIAPTSSLASLQVIRNATAQDNTGQVDWVTRPPWARYLKIFIAYTASAGTTPLVDFKLREIDPVTLDDTYVADSFQWNGITQLSAVGNVLIQVGPGVTGIADDDTAPFYSLNGPLPPYMGFVTTLDRTTGNETYTYSIAAVFSD